jgi:lipopolysaccharide transport system permease protein
MARESPVTDIDARRRWLGVREMWGARELVWNLAWRDLKLRYRQTDLGPIWAVARPLLTMGVFAVLFRLLLSDAAFPGTPGVPYVLSCLCGLAPWQLFARGVTGASQSLVLNRGLITKVYFPRLVPPLAALLAACADFAIALAVLVVLLVIYGVAPHASLWLLPGWILLGAGAAFAIGIWGAGLNALLRDVGHAVDFLVTLAMLLTPVVYTAAAITTEQPSWVRDLVFLNPMTLVCEGFRAALVGGPVPSMTDVLCACAVVGGVGLTGWATFVRLEPLIVDRV